MSSTSTLLVTGGAGFIGSHTCLDLLEAGHRVVVVDDLSNGSTEALRRVEALTGRALALVAGDVRDERVLDEAFGAYDVDAVVHFAAKKAVGESVEQPLAYYETNLTATIRLLAAMERHGVTRLVFSSSCSIYGNATSMPIAEDAPPAPTNPYARTKLMCEQILRDVCARWPEWSVMSLRYFNPAGAHPSGELGEDPRGVPTNVLPYLMQVAVGRRGSLSVFGDDYPTPDGTGIRDYLHVLDVAEAHRLAYDQLAQTRGFHVYNLGTGTGSSVLDLIEVLGAVVGRPVPYRVVGRRAGDVAELVADPTRAALDLGWKARRGLHDIVRDAWTFQRRHPDGYVAVSAEPRRSPLLSPSGARSHD